MEAHDWYTEEGGPMGGETGFFERERSRLIADISKGVESIVANTNLLNRKIEESISVGNEFHPISELWSKFQRIMVASGIPNLSAPDAPNSSTTPHDNIQPPPDNTDHIHQHQPHSFKFLDAPSTTTSLPPGVAPGGGRIYA